MLLGYSRQSLYIIRERRSFFCVVGLRSAQFAQMGGRPRKEAAMARKKNEFVKASGTAQQIFEKLANATYDNGGTDDDLRRILSDKSLAPQLGGMIVASRFAPGNMAVSPFFPVAVDYRRTVVGMMRDLKIYSGFDEHRHCLAPGKCITPDMFRFEGRGRIEDEVAIVEFNESAVYGSSEEIFDRLDKSGLQHAKVEYLFAFAERYPGMVFSDYLLVPGCGEGRHLAELVAMGSPIVRPTDNVKGYPYLDWNGMSAHRYFSVVWNLQMPVRPRLLVVRKGNVAKIVVSTFVE